MRFEVVLPLARNYLKERRIGIDYESSVLGNLTIMMKELRKSHTPYVCKSHKKFLDRLHPFYRPQRPLGKVEV
jgi:hypothetical protein